MHYHDPDAASIFRERLALAIEAFKGRKITDTVFTATLKSHGFFGTRLWEEFRYWESIRYDEELRSTASHL